MILYPDNLELKGYVDNTDFKKTFNKSLMICITWMRYLDY
jgi:hypothetical protein